MSDSPDTFADQDWMLLRCVPCASLFRVSTGDAGLAVHCPVCRAFLAVPSAWNQGVQPAPEVPVASNEPLASSPGAAPPSPSLGPRKVREMPVRAASPRNLAAKAAGQEFAPLRNPADGFAIPPSRPKAEYQVPVLIVPNTNTVKSPPVHGKGERPRLDHLDRIATTSDARFTPDPNAPKPPRPIPLGNGRNRGKSIVAWDEEDAEAGMDPAHPRPFRRYLTIAGAGAMALVIATLLIHLLRDVAQTATASADGAPTIADDAVAGSLSVAEARSASNALLDTLRNGIMPAAQSFLEAASVEERLAFVRDPERIRPLMERHARERGEDGPYSYRELGSLASVLASGNFFIVPVTLQDFTERKLAIEKVEDRFLVDWESFVAYSDMPFIRFMEEQPREPQTFRAIASRGDYYNYGFTEKNYVCFFLLEPHSNQVLYAYAPRHSQTPGHRLAEDLVRQGNSPLYVIARLRVPPNPMAANQVLLDEYIQRGWVLRPEGAAPVDGSPDPTTPSPEPTPSPSAPPAAGGVSRNSQPPLP